MKIIVYGLITLTTAIHSTAWGQMSFNTITDCHNLENEIKSAKTLADEAEIYRKQENCFNQFKYYQVTPQPSIINLNAPFNVNKGAAPGINITPLSAPGTQLLMTQPTQTGVNAEALTGSETANNNAQKAEGKATFLGLNFGYGFALVHYKDELINKASVVNGKIVAESIKENEAKIVLEFHQILFPNKGNNSGHGPFASLLVGDGDLLNGLGFGWLYSSKNIQKNDGSGFSFGIGVVIENDVKQLANGFNVGEDLPTGETTVRFIEKDEISPFLFISNNF